VTAVAALALLISAQGASANGETKTVRIYLLSVTAHDTEDTLPPWPWKPSDEFYMVGTAFTDVPMQADERADVGNVNVKRDIKKGNTNTFNQELFAGRVDPDMEVGVALEVFDEDLARNAAEYAKTSQQIAAALAVALEFGGPVVGCEFCPAVGKGLVIASKYTQPFLETVDPDDKLAKIGQSWHYNDLSSHDGEWRFSGGTPVYSDYNYTIRYRMVVE
jgi:hypothetical protein